MDKDKLINDFEEELPDGKEIVDSDNLIYIIYPDYSFEVDIETGDVTTPNIEVVEDDTPWELAGSGTEDDPYLIESIEDLVSFSNSVNEGKNYNDKYVKLVNTLDFNLPFSYINPKTKVSEKTNRIIKEDSNGTELKTFLTTGTGFNPIGFFYGVFDGNGKIIKNIYINREEDNVGLFGNANGRIEKLGLTGNITGGKSDYSYVGGLVGNGGSVSIKYCFSNTNITSEHDTVGGITGTGGNIEYCYNFGTIKAGNSYGGISSKANFIKNCYNYGKINGGKYFIGGIASFGTIENSYNLGEVTGNSDNSYGIGGIVGSTQASIKNSYNKGIISGTSDSQIGGIVGNYYEISDNGIENNYYLKGTAKGGLGNKDIEGKAMPLEESEMPSVMEVVSTGNEQVEYNGEMVDIWKEDVNNINNGYPILFWQ